MLGEGTRKEPRGQREDMGNTLAFELGDKFIGIYFTVEKQNTLRESGMCLYKDKETNNGRGFPFFFCILI